MMPGKPTLITSDLRLSLGGNTILRGIDLELHAGEVVALLGPNGAGKSTFVDVLSGVLKCDAGRVSLAGEDISHRPVWARSRSGLGRLFQEIRPFLQLTVLENLLAVGQSPRLEQPWAPFFWWKRVAAAEKRRKAAALAVLAELGLEAAADQRADSLSLGDLRLLAVARVLFQEPVLMLLDEPFAGQNAYRRDRMVEAFERRAADGVCQLIIEHDYPLALDIADRIVVLNAGRVMLDRPTDELSEEALLGVLQ